MPKVSLPWFLVLSGSLWERVAGSCDILRYECCYYGRKHCEGNRSESEHVVLLSLL